MNQLEKLNLQKMISENDVKDNTSLIRTYKHSDKIKRDVERMIELKKSMHKSPELDSKCESECFFLFLNYTDIYNKVKKDNIELSILYQFLECLKKVENGEQDQHEASFEIGKLLKAMYVDSALKKADKIKEKESELPEPKNVSWSEYKKTLS